MKKRPNINDTVKQLKALSVQIQKLSKLKLEESSKEIARYAAIIAAEERRRK